MKISYLFPLLFVISCVAIDHRGIRLQVPHQQTVTKAKPTPVTAPPILTAAPVPPPKSLPARVKTAELDEAIHSAQQATQQAVQQKAVVPKKRPRQSTRATTPVAAAVPAVDIAHRYKYKVRGEEYGVFKSSKNFQEIGTASWYGQGFHGKLTANGERFDMNALTAAHKTLPLGSWVQVRNLDNGLTVVVRINDRGPFHRGRIIDLSKKAAQQLGILKRGYGRVHIKIVKGE